MTRPIIAILRGITKAEINAAAEVLIEAGIKMIEVPLNSPDPFATIEELVKTFGDQAQCGAGTVLAVREVERLSDIGARLVISPNCDVDVIKATKARGMQSYPGVMTPSECFAALQAGADGLKFFPGELVGPVGLKAMRAVLPNATTCYAVGGARPDNFAEWMAAGATGFGIGSALYRAGDATLTLKSNAHNIVKAYDEAVQ